jgi:hypothetical protein
MRITFFRILVTIALFWGGGQGLYTALFNLKPRDYSVADYLKAKPSTKWLNLTGGFLDITGMSYTGSKLSGTIKEVYIPLLPAKSNEEGLVHILVSSKDPALIELATQLRDAKDQLAVLKILMNKGGVYHERPVNGLIRFGIDLTDKDAKKLRDLNSDLAPDFVILAEGESPSFGVSILMFLGGLTMLFLFIKGAARKSTPPALPAAPAEPPTQA